MCLTEDRVVFFFLTTRSTNLHRETLVLARALEPASRVMHSCKVAINYGWRTHAKERAQAFESDDLPNRNLIYTGYLSPFCLQGVKAVGVASVPKSSLSSSVLYHLSERISPTSLCGQPFQCTLTSVFSRKPYFFYISL